MTRPRLRLKKSESQWRDWTKDVDAETPSRLSRISGSEKIRKLGENEKNWENKHPEKRNGKKIKPQRKISPRKLKKHQIWKHGKFGERRSFRVGWELQNISKVRSLGIHQNPPKIVQKWIPGGPEKQDSTLYNISRSHHQTSQDTHRKGKDTNRQAEYNTRYAVYWYNISISWARYNTISAAKWEQFEHQHQLREGFKKNTPTNLGFWLNLRWHRPTFGTWAPLTGEISLLIQYDLHGLKCEMIKSSPSVSL